jgi:hypothetical protein
MEASTMRAPTLVLGTLFVLSASVAHATGGAPTFKLQPGGSGDGAVRTAVKKSIGSVNQQLGAMRERRAVDKEFNAFLKDNPDAEAMHIGARSQGKVRGIAAMKWGARVAAGASIAEVAHGNYGFLGLAALNVGTAGDLATKQKRAERTAATRAVRAGLKDGAKNAPDQAKLDRWANAGKIDRIVLEPAKNVDNGVLVLPGAVVPTF